MFAVLELKAPFLLESHERKSKEILDKTARNLPEMASGKHRPTTVHCSLFAMSCKFVGTQPEKK